MDGYRTIKETALLWDVSERRVNEYCRNSRIPGAKKDEVTDRWKIPKDAEKPLDLRMKEPKRVDEKKVAEKKMQEGRTVLCGTMSFKEAVLNDAFVGQTLFLKECLKRRDRVSFLLRPHGFGKTVLLQMVREFFDADGDGKKLFQNTNIVLSGEEIENERGRYPVLFFSFGELLALKRKDVKRSLVMQIRREAARKERLLREDGLSSFEKRLAEDLVAGKDEGEPFFLLDTLMRLLKKEYGTAPLVLIDDYDAPLLVKRSWEEKEKVQSLFQNLFAYFRENQDTFTAIFLTGRVHPGNLGILPEGFSCPVYDCFSEDYRESAGFSEKEARKLCEKFQSPVPFSAIRKEWGGYNLGGREIYPPKGVVASLQGKREVLWSSRGKKALEDLLCGGTANTLKKLEQLLSGKEVPVVFSEDDKAYDGFCILLEEGLLTGRVLSEGMREGIKNVSLRIPNEHARGVFLRGLAGIFTESIPDAVLADLREAMFLKDRKLLVKTIGSVFEKLLSEFAEDKNNTPTRISLGLFALFGGKVSVKVQKKELSGKLRITLTSDFFRISFLMQKTDAEGESEAKKQVRKLLKDLKTKEAHMIRDPAITEVRYGAVYGTRMMTLAWEIEE